MRHDFVDTVISILGRSGLAPTLLDLEITETVVMHSLEEVSAKISQLRRMGVSISMDDFGTGYSSLNHLQKPPINSLKIDRSFVRDIAVNPDAVSLTRALVSLAITNRPQDSILPHIGGGDQALELIPAADSVFMMMAVGFSASPEVPLVWKADNN